MPAFVALAVLTLPAPTDGSAISHAACTAVHAKWVELHEEKDSGSNDLIIAPRQDAMWVGAPDRKQDSQFMAALPTGLQWHAFHVTQAGILELQFPVRLSKPRPNVVAESEEELVWIVGTSAGMSVQMSFAAVRSGIGFHIGSGSPAGNVVFHLPEKSAVGGIGSHESILRQDVPIPGVPCELIRKDRFRVEVARRSAKATTE